MVQHHHLVKLDYMDSEDKLYKIFNRDTRIDKEFDFDWLNKYIAENKKVIRYVQIGFSEDWGCSEIYFEHGRTNEYHRLIPMRTSWATPTALVVFYDGTEVTFSCYKYIIQFTLWEAVKQGVSFIYESIYRGCVKLLRMCRIL